MISVMIVTLDVRDLKPRERHATILARFDALTVGDTLRLVSDSDPAHVRNQLLAERAGKFSWAPEAQGPGEWIIRIEKMALP